MAGRADQLLPEGWRPKLGSVVHVEPSKDDPTPPAGLWKVYSAAPDTGTWWLLALDDDARTWARAHPDLVTSGSVARSGRHLVPKGYRRPRPSDLSPAALARVAGGAA